MSRRMLRFAAGLAAAAGAPPAALAGCVYAPFEFFPEKNGGVVVDAAVTRGGPCAHNFAEGAGYHFDSVAIDREPEHGRLEQEGPTRFRFAPSPGFRGKDFYGFKICATKGEAKGCSTLFFVVTVK